jgi:serine/threonine protein kinase
MIRRDRGGETLDEQYSTIWSEHDDGPEPSAVDFLADHPDASPSERLDVLLIDQVLRWGCGRPEPVADYLAEHPSLADDPEAILKLVQGEFLARLARGEAPEADSYIRMFPGLAEEIRLQCEVDRWLTLPSPADLPSMPTTVDYQDDNATDDGTGPASASPLPADLDAPLLGADFELVRPLGSGGMGEVFEAVQKSLRKRVALKLIRPEALDSPSRVRRFFTEARALARLRHPHIVGVHGIGRMADGRYFLVMDLVEGGTTLAALLRQEPVSFDRAAGLVATVAEAIEHAHSRGVIHRDLKPSNVLLDAEGRPHVTDFGLAKVFDSVDPDSPQTTADRILGTPHYMAPEQADRARGPITPRTDVYALGGLLYALLTGQPPIQGDSLTAILTRVVSPEPVPTPRERRGDVPAALEQICGTCLEKDAEKRYPSAGAVAEALRVWLANPEADDSAAVAAGSQGPTARSSDDLDSGRTRSGWATDRSLKDGRRAPNPGRWAPKSARPAGSRRTTWAAGAVASTLAVSITLVTWLYSWFSPKQAQKGQVEAYFVAADDIPPEEVPFQAADVRSLRGSSGSGAIQATNPAELAPEVLKKVKSGGSPLVVYISAPMLVQGTKATGEPLAGLIGSVAGESRRDVVLALNLAYVSAPVLVPGADKPGEPVWDLISTVAKETKRDVVLALDVAQIDSDRDLGVFGNSPYARLAEQVRRLDKPAGHVFVMTSAAPAQKSWSADGLGQSIFAYYLRKGLEGEAKGWDGTEPERITVEGLHRYVLDRVRRWARLRRESVQTPLLLPVLPEGEKPSKVVLQTIPKGDPAPASPAPVEVHQAAVDTKPAKLEAEGKAAPAARQETAQSPPAEPAPEAVRSPMDRLFDEWKRHEALAQRSPYRDLPGAWRSYEAALLRAERGLRAAYHDPALWGRRADDLLIAAQNSGGQIKQELDAREKARKGFRFVPVQGDPEGPQELASALRFLNPKVRLPAWLALAAAPAESKAGPDKDAGKPGPVHEAANPPIALSESFSSAASEAPSRFLELQLPRWAYGFTADFNCPDYFRDPGRMDVLLRLVELRGTAERALATDRRGVSWIKTSIKRGDRGRRAIQDKLFGMASNGQGPEQETQLAAVGRAYDTALEAIKSFHDARDAWERAAAELPYTAEYAIWVRARSGSGKAAIPSNPLPEPVDEALKALESLAPAMNSPPADGEGDDESSASASRERLRGLVNATARVREAIGELRRDFEQSTDRYIDRPPGWVELDAALRVPLLSSDKRRSLLEKLLRLGDSIAEDDKKAGQPEADSPPDRGFWIRAAGLARLDLELRRLSQGSADAEAFGGETVQAAWRAARQSADDRGATPEALRLFGKLTERITGLRAAARTALLATSEDDADRDLGGVEKDLRARESRVRHLTAAEVEQIPKVDYPVRDHDRLAECACLEFHLDRLQEDYTADLSLNELWSRIDEIKTSLRIKRLARPPGGAPGLSVKMTPDGQRDIGDDWKTSFQVIVAGPPGSASEQRPMPDGEVFVGLAAGGVVEGLTANDRVIGKDVPGDRIPVPIGPKATRAVPFRVDQKTDAVKLPTRGDILNLAVKVFYRGHSDLVDPLQVAVKPNRIPTRIEILISQDREKLDQKYRRDVAERIPDQFVKHPGEGYMHKGKDFDYVLEIANKTPRPLTITCKRFLIDEMGQKNEIPAQPINNFDLFPRQPLRIKGNINLSRNWGGRPVKLSVEVTDKQGAIPPFVVTFKEVGYQFYMKIDPRTEPSFRYTDETGNRTVGPCFLVPMARDAQDPVTEPIARTELKCQFNSPNLDRGITGEEPGEPWLWPGQQFYFYQPLRDVTPPLKWWAQIQTERTETKAFDPD